MRPESISQFVSLLESEGGLHRVKTPVNTFLEISEITDRVVKSNGKALLFEKTGTEFPLLINAFGSDRRLEIAFGLKSLDEISADLEKTMEILERAGGTGLKKKVPVVPEFIKIARRFPKKTNRRGRCQDVVMEKPDLYKLPIITCWPGDGGPFITLPLVHTKDPLTGTPNTGMYRMQVYDSITTGMHWHLHKDGAAHFNKYKEMGQIMPVTVTLGGDPLLTYAATAPLPPFIDEMLLAGVIRKKGVKLVKSLTNDIWIPESSDFVIEGYIDPSEPFRKEGPFGDHTGFYSLADMYPTFHVTAISHRRDAVYPTTIVGIPPQEDFWLGKATGKLFMMPLQKTIAPELVKMEMPKEGVFHNIVVASVKQPFPGTPQKVAASLWGAGQMMFNKVLVILPEEADPGNSAEVVSFISKSVKPETDLFFQSGPLDVLDHSSSEFAFGGKMGVDSTKNRNLPNANSIDDDTIKTIIELKGVASVSMKAIEKGAPLLMVFIDKSPDVKIKNIHNQLVALVEEFNVRFVFYMDSAAATFNLSDCLWIMAGNTDPQRDLMLGKTKEGNTVAGFDGTRKLKEVDMFQRDWPNPVVQSESIIALVSSRWKDYGLGDDPGSPSLKYQSYMAGPGAVADISKPAVE